MKSKIAGRLAGIAASMICALVGISACGYDGIGAPDMDKTMTIRQANDRLDEHIQRAAEQISGAKLNERLRQENSRCTDPSDQGSENRVNAQRDYELLGIKSAEIPDHYETLKTWWQRNSFFVLDNNPKYEYLWVENKNDGVRLALQASEGHLFIVGSSPCVWPNGTPEAS